VDSLLRCGTLPEESEETANFKRGTGNISPITLVQSTEKHPDKVFCANVISDGDGSMTLPVAGGDNLTENYVGSHFANYDSFLVLSHFKGYAMAGFGGAIKNISIGIASSSGKSHIHSSGTGGSMWSADQHAFLDHGGSW